MGKNDSETQIPEGSALIAAAKADNKAYFNSTHQYTHFTAAFIDILENGINNTDTEQIDTNTLFVGLDKNLSGKNFDITKKTTHKIDKVSFFKNKGFDEISRTRKIVTDYEKRGDAAQDKLELNNAELYYLKAKNNAKPNEFFNDEIQRLDNKLNKIEYLKQYAKKYEDKYKTQNTKTQEEQDKTQPKPPTHNTNKTKSEQPINIKTEHSEKTPEPLQTEEQEPQKKKKGGFRITKKVAIIMAIELLVVIVIAIFLINSNEESDWQTAQDQNTTESYQKYLEHYPQGEFAKQAQQNIDWIDAQAQNTMHAYKQFNNKYAENNPFAEFIAQKIAALHYDSISNNIKLAELREFLASNTAQQLDTNYQNKAHKLLADLVNDSTQYANNAELRKADLKAYNNAKRKASKTAYEKYISQYPEGQYLADAKRAIKNIGKIILPEMVYIHGGTFEMGSNDGGYNEKPIHTVTVSSFSMSKYEITFAQYDAFCNNTNRKKPSDNNWGRGNRPVINVTWHDAVAYCKWLSQQTGKNYRLPTEAEWEYAAGGGSQHTKYAGTNGSPSSYSVYDIIIRKTYPVGQKKTNKYGLYDMTGNVWEWCSDWYDEHYYKNSPSNNPKGASKGSYRVLRGGGWHGVLGNCLVTNRSFNSPGNSDKDVGFRIASP